MKFLLLSRRQQTRYILPKSGPCADAFIVAVGLAPGVRRRTTRSTQHWMRSPASRSDSFECSGMRRRSWKKRRVQI